MNRLRTLNRLAREAAITDTDSQQDIESQRTKAIRMSFIESRIAEIDRIVAWRWRALENLEGKQKKSEYMRKWRKQKR